MTWERAQPVGEGSDPDHLAVLLTASRALGCSLDYEATLAQLADLAVPRIADWCAVTLLHDDPGQAWLVVRCADPALRPLAEEIQRAGPPLFSDRAMGLRLRASDQSLLVPRIDDALVASHVSDPAARELIRYLGLRSAVIAPLKVANRVIGTLALAHAKSGRSYTQRDLDLIAELANHAAMSVENARLYQTERRARREAERAADCLRRLHDVTTALGGARTPEEVARVMAVQGAKALGARQGLVVVESADGTSLEPIGPQESGDSADLITSSIPRQTEPSIFTALREGRPFWFDTREKLANYFPDVETFLGRQPPPGSSIVLPLFIEGRAIGGVVWTFDQERTLADDERQIALALARECALAMARARLEADARRAIQVRDEFISIAAHEMRAPLAGVRALAHTALWHLRDAATLDPDSARLRLEEIDRLGQMLSRLLAHLLDASRIESGRFTILPLCVDVVPLVQKAVDRMRASDPTHVFSFQGPPTLALEADPVRLDQVVTNLLDNAAKFSSTGNTVEATLDVDRAEAVLTVRDHGEGIPPANRGHIFEPFYQVPGHHEFGIGLGLYISREIVVQHRGTITVECPSDGGSQFTVRLPIHRA